MRPIKQTSQGHNLKTPDKLFVDYPREDPWWHLGVKSIRLALDLQQTLEKGHQQYYQLSVLTRERNPQRYTTEMIWEDRINVSTNFFIFLRLFLLYLSSSGFLRDEIWSMFISDSYLIILLKYNFLYTKLFPFLSLFWFYIVVEVPCNQLPFTIIVIIKWYLKLE